MTLPTNAPESTLPPYVDRLPGVLLSAVVAWFGILSSEFIGTELLGFEKSPISGIMMAIVIGLLIGNLIQIPLVFHPGLRFSLKMVLKVGIILLGIRLSMAEVLRLGVVGIPLIIFCLTGAILITNWLGKRLGISNGMSTLIAVGTSICGATAIVATGPAIEARREELTYAVANITVFGIIAMFLYPFAANALFADDPTAAGLFLGTSIHETAQVAGSGLIYEQLYDSSEALESATITKLVRNVLMAVIIPLMAIQYSRRHDTDTTQYIDVQQLFPMFILGFIFMAIVRSVGDAMLDNGNSAWGIWDAEAWDSLTGFIRTWAENFLAMAMAAVGLGTRFATLRGLGLKPFYVGFVAAVAVGGLSLIGIFALSGLGLI